MSYSFAFIGELLKKGKRFAVSYIVADCLENRKSPEHLLLLHHVAEYLLNPTEKINKADVIEWIRWLLGAGKNPDEFGNEVVKHDTATTCGLVWIANFVAYRCRTCAISPCMSLCAQCFQKGEHEGHDFNMFRSLAGGACDCGDESVMKKTGFCCRHSQEKKQHSSPTANSSSTTDLSELLYIAHSLMPKIINRLLVELRRNDPAALEEIDVYLTNLLSPLTAMGAPMRTIISQVLLDPEVYQKYAKNCETIGGLERKNFLISRQETYLIARKAMPNFNLKHYYKGCSICPPNQCTLRLENSEFHHDTFVEELLFWTVQYEFPQKLVCFLLNMLRDAEYKAHFARSFVYHYSRTSMMLANFRNPDDAANAAQQANANKPTAHDLLSNCVVHVSVQLLSNESLAFKLCEEEHLLFILIASLKATIEGADAERSNLTASKLQDPQRNQHKVVKCDHHVMKKHFYWPLVSDLNNILTHRRVALMFIRNRELFELWLGFVLDFQGMNLNTRELQVHVEFENDSYYASFSSELEICATSLWTIMLHNREPATASLTVQVVHSTLAYLNKWFRLIGFSYEQAPNPLHCTFHIPLHRYYSIFLRNGVAHQGLHLDELLPTNEEQIKLLLAHPLQIQINFYEILCTLWVRNGLQMKGQAMTYIQCHFCNSMIDPDLFLIQQLASKLSPDWFVRTVLERFHIYDWLSFRPAASGAASSDGSFVFNFNNLYSHHHQATAGNLNEPHHQASGPSFLEPEQIMPMCEAALTFLCTLFTVQTNLGLSEEEIIRKEMVTLLCMADRTYSQLHDLLPEKCGTSNNKNCFDKNLAEIADFRSPALEAGGNVSQGMFHPKPHIWLNEYDPLYVLLRAVHRRDYQSSFDRFTQFIKSADDRKERNKQLWPPFRLPRDLDNNFADPKKLLYSKVLHGFIFTILYRSLYTNDVSEQVLALTVFLLQLSLVANKPENDSPAVKLAPVEFADEELDDLAFEDWFGSNWILENMNIIVQDVAVYEKSQRKNNSCILFSSETGGQGQADENLEMEVDFLFPTATTSDDNVNFNEDEYMNDVENMMNERREFIERIDEMPPQLLLPSSSVPLALTEGDDRSAANQTGGQGPAASDQNIRSSASSSSSSNSLSSSSSTPLLAILSASAEQSAPAEATGEQPTSNNTPNSSNASDTQAIKVSSSSSSRRNNLRLNRLTLQNLHFARRLGEQQANTETGSSYASGPSTSPQMRSLPIDNANWMNSFKITSIVPVTGQNSSLSPPPQPSDMRPSTSGGPAASGGPEAKGPSLPFLRRFHSQNRRNKYNRKRCSLEFKQHHQPSAASGPAADGQISICELLGTGQQPATVCSSSNLVKRKVTVNESLISLLLKLHSKLSGKQDSYQFSEASGQESAATAGNRIGDATHFIRQVLDLYCHLNAATGRQAIQTWKVKLWPFNYTKTEPEPSNLSASPAANLMDVHSPMDADSPISSLDKEERRRRAKERQQKLMAEFANKQKAFMKQMNEEFEEFDQPAKGQTDGEPAANKGPSSDLTVDVCSKLQYECVICGQTTPSTPERLIGMVVLLQSSSILAHCKPRYPIDTLKKTRSLRETELAHEGRTQLIDEETVQLNKKQTLGTHMEERIDLLDGNFNKSSWFNAINIGWEGGVHIQSCGHYLHLDCHCSYMQSLKASRLRGRISGNDNGEFSCPLCRQMGNSVLPINPDINRRTNLKHYAKQIRQFNLKRPPADFSSVNRHVAKMFELLAFGAPNNHQQNDDDDDDDEAPTGAAAAGQQDDESNDPISDNDVVPIEHRAAGDPKASGECATVDSPIQPAPLLPSLFSDEAPASGESQFRENCLELMSLYTRIPTPDSGLLKSFGFFCEDLTKATGPQYRSVKTSPTPHALYLFMCSILRTNLETELLVKLSKSAATGAKKSCFVPLFHVLALNCHFLIPQYYTSFWSQLTGLPVPEDFRESIAPSDKEVPLMLVDTCAMLIQLLFALPLNVDEKYYDSIVQNLYNLTAMQALSQITGFFNADERSAMIQQQPGREPFETPAGLIGYIVAAFESANPNLFRCLDQDEPDAAAASRTNKWKPAELTDLAVNMVLPFVRLAALLKCYLYNREYPTFGQMSDEQFRRGEYLNLARVLNLGASPDSGSPPSFIMPHFACEQPLKLIDIWLHQYTTLSENSPLVAIKLLHWRPIHFVSPKLLNLPPTYDQLFLHYYQKPCSTCDTCPKEPCICFLCARLVCMRQECCRKADGIALEATHHSQVCGAGTALYLAVYSSTVIVIRGRRACVWGSVYLDMHGEEDRDLKRGRPLYLSQLRYNVLEQQWLTHSFDHTNKRFVLHKDMI